MNTILEFIESEKYYHIEEVLEKFHQLTRKLNTTLHLSDEIIEQTTNNLWLKKQNKIQDQKILVEEYLPELDFCRSMKLYLRGSILIKEILCRTTEITEK